MTVPRPARREDIPAMHRVRMAVRENRLVSRVITEADYAERMVHAGAAWVVEEDRTVVGFAIGDVRDHSIWALFVHPDHEGRGRGRALHDTLVAWMRGFRGRILTLETEAGTRAECFYRAAGWQVVGRTPDGALRLELPPA